MPPTAVKQRPGNAPSASYDVVKRLQPISIRKGIKIGVYGHSGTGKTRLWSTFPKPIIAAICSAGDETRSIKKNTPGIETVDLLNEEELSQLAQYQRETNGHFKTFVIDHVTAYQDLILKKILGRDPPPQIGWGVVTQQQWGEVTLGFKERIGELIQLTCNVYIAGQEREFNTDTKSDVIFPYVGFGLTPSAAGWLHPAVDYLCNTFIRDEVEEQVIEMAGKKVKQRNPTGKKEYCLRTGPDSTYKTKFRVPRGVTLPDVIVDPTWDKLVPYLGE